jgi:colicin import membrane protein/protein TonB
MPTPAPAKPAAKPAAPVRPAPTRNPANGAGIADALARVEKQVKREQWGDPNGDPAGDSADASEGERYFALLKRSVQDNFHAPSTLTDQERIRLVTKVTLWVEPDGTLARWHVEQPSGNGSYDAAVERALRAARPPPPPDDQREALRSRGITLDFKPND